MFRYLLDHLTAPPSWLSGLTAILLLLWLTTAGAYFGRNRETKPLARAFADSAAVAIRLQQVDLNTADSLTLVRLPGIGPVLAGRLLAFRRTHGPFRTVDDLLRVRGLGRALEKARPYLFVQPTVNSEAAPAVQEATRPPMDINRATLDDLLAEGVADERFLRRMLKYRDASGGFRNWEHVARTWSMTPPMLAALQKRCFIAAPAPKPRLNLNTADSAALEALPQIGEKLSVRILRYREVLGFYTSAEQLREVYGLRPDAYEIVAPLVYVDKNTATFPHLRINQLSVRELRRHPYLRASNTARRLVAVRDSLGGFRSDTEIKTALTDSLWRLLAPYIRLE